MASTYDAKFFDSISFPTEEQVIEYNSIQIVRISSFKNNEQLWGVSIDRKPQEYREKGRNF